MTTIQSLSELDGTPHANVFPEAEPKTIRLTLEAGDTLPAHQHPNRDIVFFVREGALDLHVGGETHVLEGGDIARFAGEQDISPAARTDTTALIVLAPRPRGD
jgi:quercetin dioxygenase-like cupin family protein